MSWQRAAIGAAVGAVTGAGAGLLVRAAGGALAGATVYAVGGALAGATVGAAVAARKTPSDAAAAAKLAAAKKFALGQDSEGSFTPNNAELAAFVAGICNNGPELVHGYVESCANYAEDFHAGPVAGGSSNRATWERAMAQQRVNMHQFAWTSFSYGLQKNGSFWIPGFTWIYDDGIPAFVRWQVLEHKAELRARMLKLATQPSQIQWPRMQYDELSISESWSRGGVTWLEQTRRGVKERALVQGASDVELPGILESMLWARTVPLFLKGPSPAPEVDWGDVFSFALAWAGAAVSVATAGAAGGLMAAGVAAYEAGVEW